MIEPDPVFQVGDLVTRMGADVQRVTKADDGYGCITVVCVKAPPGWVDEDGKPQEPWCKVGDVEHNLSRRYSYAGGVVDVMPTRIAGLLPSGEGYV